MLRWMSNFYGIEIKGIIDLYKTYDAHYKPQSYGVNEKDRITLYSDYKDEFDKYELLQ